MKKNNKILLIVTGSIAAYKAAEILRKLKDFESDVKVILTSGAEQFVRPLNFSALGASKVYTESDAFTVDSDGVSVHLSVSRWADAILVAPASADFVAKISNGIADCIACTSVLAFNDWKNVFIAPAMNEKMYDNDLTRMNIEKLKGLGVNFIGPVSGKLADNSEGKGRMEEPEKIVQTVIFALSKDGPLSGKKVLITAGATREYIDPVRFISNGSSGTMGFEIAKAVKLAGGEVYLIAAHHTANLPLTNRLFYADTTEDLLKQTKSNFEIADILIMAAAPVDFKPEERSFKKIKKKEEFALKLVSTPDILKEVSKNKRNKIIVGFALQTEDVEESALNKMKEKNMDIVVANSQENLGKQNGSVIIMDKYGNKEVVINKNKRILAEKIVRFLIEYENKEVKNG